MRQNALVFRVQWGETDAAGIVFYPNYFRWFDWGSHELLRSLGFPLENMVSDNHALPIIDAGARFLRSLRYGDEVTLISSVAEVRTRAFRVAHEIDRGSERICQGFEVRVWGRLGDSDHPVVAEPIPENMRTALVSASSMAEQSLRGAPM